MFRTMIFGLGNIFWASLVAYMEKNLLAMQETWGRPLGWEDPLDKEMATHSSILAWRIPRTEEPLGLQSMGLQRVRHDCATNTFTSCILEQFGNIFWKDFKFLGEQEAK